MNIVDLYKGIKIARQERINKEKRKALQGSNNLIGTYADNAVNKFREEYFIQTHKGKRECTIHCNPYPDAQVMQKMFAKAKISKKEYLNEFQKILASKLEQHGFTNFTLSENRLSKKEPVSVKVKW